MYQGSLSAYMESCAHQSLANTEIYTIDLFTFSLAFWRVSILFSLLLGQAEENRNGHMQKTLQRNSAVKTDSVSAGDGFLSVNHFYAKKKTSLHMITSVYRN